MNCDYSEGNANKYRKLLLTLFALGLLALSAGPLYAQAPPNDNFADATVIDWLAFTESHAFTDTVDNTRATPESGEPQPCYYSSEPRTVWYEFTPGANVGVRADMAGSSFYDTVLTVYRDAGSGLGGLNFLSCGAFGSSVAFFAQAGTTYYIQAGSIYCCGGTLRLNLNEVPPPANDHFANATHIATLPFNDNGVDTTAATTETGEPGPTCTSTPAATIWYAFTPRTSGSVSAYVYSPFYTLVAAYTGSGLTELREIPAACDTPGCRGYGGVLTFRADAGTTYYFQVGGLDANARGLLEFHLLVTPPPVAYLYLSLYDPSIFDTLQFYNFSYDPVGLGIQSQSWDFGDGQQTVAVAPTHRYAADGDYTVKLTVTTCDGRTGSTSQVVHVETRDVAITKFLTPNAAASGQTRTITVGVNSKRYPENVMVQLLKSRPGSSCYSYGYECVGSLTQSVPVRSANRTTDFNFSYTFTSDDAGVGKVTFKAIATINGPRDAQPADNEAIAPSTKVTR